MNASQRLLPPVLAALFIASCGGGSENLPADANRVLQYQPAGEELRLATLQVGPDVYPDVALRLAPDGAWALESVGTLRPLQPHESPQAVLQASEGTTLAPGWRPSVATITVRRLHIGGKVYGNVPLQLAGGSWFWGSARQAGNDTQDLHELKALALADFQANPALAATDTHHTVLHSSPERRTQSFPMRLEARQYRFCMDAQEEGTDSVRVVDGKGTAVLTVRAGESCAERLLPAGLYALEHEYGGLGATRTIFVRPSRDAAAAAAKAAPAASAAGAVPEYWAIHVPGTDSHPPGFLSFNDAQTDPHKACNGFIDAAAQADRPSARPGQWGLSFVRFWDTRNFFEASAGSAGTLVGYPLSCSQKGLQGAGYLVGDTVTAEVLAITTVSPGGLSFAPDGGKLQVVSNGDDTFELEARCASCMMFGTHARLGFPYGSIMGPASAADVQFTYAFWYSSLNFYGLQAIASDWPKQRFSAPLRYFPQGLPAAMRDASGLWQLKEGEVALFAGKDCSGAALVTRHEGRLVPPDQAFDGKSFRGSLQLGPNTVATFGAGSGARHVNQSGCVASTSDADFASNFEISVTRQIDIQTDSCEYCNLAGLDFSGQAATLKGVKLQHANLTEANLSNSDLSRADLRSAILQGANLSYANLDAANLCNASLNGRQLPNGSSGVAAQMGGAHLRNANLAGAQLDGANLKSASFYSSSSGACVPNDCTTYSLPACATANGATANNASFVSAYLADADMTGLTANGADFSSAILFGTRLVNAKLNRSPSTGRSVSFGSALLHGADFSNAAVDYASFLGASVDADPANNCMQINLASEYLSFPGFTVPSGASCVAPASVPAQSCVRATYGARVTPVLTNATNICANGNQGPCLPDSWGKVVKNTSTCAATAPLCGNPFTGSTENTCWR